MLTLRRPSIEQICSGDEGVYLMYTTEEHGQRCQWMAEALTYIMGQALSAHLAKVSLNSTDPVLLIGERYRRFSCREAARIQSFPDSFSLDVVADNRQYKAIGNAVPPVMMWHIANSLQRAFEISDGYYEKSSPKSMPQYAFSCYDSVRGVLFEQDATYGNTTE